MALLMGPDQIAELARAITSAVGAKPPGHDPDERCAACTAALGVDDLSITMISTSRRRLTVCASSEDARVLDEWQFSLGEGPCLDAVRTNHVWAAVVSDPDATPWPLFAAKALEMGYLGVGGVPVSIGATPFAAVNLQSRSGAVDEEARRRTVALARELAHPLAEAIGSVLPEPELTLDGHRDRVDQAIGMVSAQMDVTIDEAMHVLRARAWAEDRLLAALAEDVVQRRVRFERLREGSEG
jgi:hypothetical protein